MTDRFEDVPGSVDQIIRVLEELTTISDDVESMKSEIESRKSEIESNKTRKETELYKLFRDLMRGWGDAINDIDEHMTGLKGDVDSSVGRLDRQVSGLKGDVDSSVGRLDRQVTELKKNVTGVQGQVKALQNRLVGYEKAHREETTRLRKTFLTGTGIAVGTTGIVVVGLQSVLANCGG